MRGIRAARLSAILANARTLPIDATVARAYATLRMRSGRQPTNDLWIGATAVAHGLELLTADERQAKLPGVLTRLIRASG